MKYENNENVFWPRKIKFSDIWINTLWALISWIIWSIILLFIIFLISWFIDVPWTFNTSKIWLTTNALFPFVLSIIAFLASTIVVFSTYKFLTITDPEKYKKTIIHFWQLAFFAIITYIFITPVYIYSWLQNYNNIMIVFLIHILFLSFWASLLLEILNNYRYVLIWFYWSFIGLFITWIITLLIFFSFTWWYAKLISLLVLLPLSNSLIILLKWIFEYLYYQYYKITWFDQLWDIFYQIELEEKEQLKEAEEQNI